VVTVIERGQGIAAAAEATGATIVIDTFRAFTTAAVLLDRGVDPLYLTADVDIARDIARDERAILIGEDLGVRPEGFDLGNSPAEALTAGDLAGRCAVQRSTAGTRSLIAAVRAGAAPVYASSLVVATATARAVASRSRVTIISAGLHGTERAVEDDLTADLITDLLVGTADPSGIAAAVAATDRAELLRRAPWSHPDDVAIAADVDRYGFAMEARLDDRGHIRLVATFGVGDPTD
jgi:2-phosphosulfolactate phosphatase